MPPPRCSQGTYEECCANETFARLLREHNADHGSAEAEGSGEDAAEVPPSKPSLMRADTGAIARRAAAEVLGAGGRTVGDPTVQQARLATVPTFVRPAAALETAGSSGSTSSADGSSDSESEEGDGAAALQTKPSQDSGKYGKQLERFETMIQQTKQEGKEGKEGKVRGRGLGLGGAGVGDVGRWGRGGYLTVPFACEAWPAADIPATLTPGLNCHASGAACPGRQGRRRRADCEGGPGGGAGDGQGVLAVHPLLRRHLLCRPHPAVEQRAGGRPAWKGRASG